MYDYVLSCRECKYRFAKLKEKKYKSTINIPVDIIQIIRAIFTGTDMFFDVLLSKCLLGQRQSTNSGFNAII